MFAVSQKIRSCLRSRSLLTAGLTGLALLACFVRISWNYDFEGVYLLKGENGRTLVVSDSVYLGEEDRLLAGIDLPGINLLEHHFLSSKTRLELHWNAAAGRGVIHNRLADGTVLVTNFSRYVDSEGEQTHGLFIGGAEPARLHPKNLDGSGMSWFDGKQWNHIWCNTNEGIGSTVSTHRYAPSHWKYLGSTVDVENDERIVLNSRHEVVVDGAPLQIKRTVEVLAGQPELKLTMQIVNGGGRAGHYFYYYGDEPWVGEFGSSAGDVGWMGGRLVKFETVIDPKTVTTIGMIDFGNDVLGERHHFRNVANFIRWSPATRPDIAFFANQYDGFAHRPEVQVPLQGDARSLGMYWGPKTLPPGATETIELTLGMAGPAELKGLLPHTAQLSPQPVRRG